MHLSLDGEDACSPGRLHQSISIPGTQLPLPVEAACPTLSLGDSLTHSLPWLWLCLGKTARRRHSELGCPKHARTPSVPLSSGCEIKLLWLDHTMAKPVFHHFRQYLFSSYHVPDTIVGTGVTTMKTRCTIATALTFPLPVLLNCAGTLSFSTGRHIPGCFFFLRFISKGNIWTDLKEFKT